MAKYKFIDSLQELGVSTSPSTTLGLSVFLPLSGMPTPEPPMSTISGQFPQSFLKLGTLRGILRRLKSLLSQTLTFLRVDFPANLSAKLGTN